MTQQKSKEHEKEFSIKKLYYFFPLFFIFLYYFHPIPLQGANVDLGHHLLLGKIIVNEKAIPDTNIFSYAAQGFPVIDTSWLSQVILYLWHNQFGFNGLTILSVFLMTITFIIMYQNIEMKNKLLSTVIISLLYFQVFIERTEVKPELFSLLLLSIFLFILYRNRSAFTKWIFILPVLEILWVNLHIYFITGPIVVSLFLIDAFLSKKHSNTSKDILALSCITSATFLATLANPHFILGAIYPLTFLSNYGYSVNENYNFFTAYATKKSLSFIYFIISVIVLWIGLVVNLKKLKPVDIFLACFFTLLGFFAIRNFHLFALGTFIPAVKGLNYILIALSQKYTKKTVKIIKSCLTVIVFLSITPAIIWTVSVHGLGLGIIDDAKDPVGLLKKNNIPGPIYNNYNIGNYLEYRFYPEEKVFVHGSPEAYPKEFFKKTYYPAETSFTSFVKESKKYKFNVVFYDHVNQTEKANPLLTGLIQSKEWKMVYLNNRIVVFVKNSATNQKFIQSHMLTENNILLKDEDFNSKDKLANLSNFFRVIGWYEKMYEMDLKYLAHDPNHCIALRHVAFYMDKTNHPLRNIYMEKFQNTCN